MNAEPQLLAHLASPYGYIRLDPSSATLDDGTELVSHPLVLYFASATERKQFATAIKRLMKQRGRWQISHLR